MNIEKSYWSSNGDDISLSIPFTKVNREKRTVSGFATLDNLDQSGDLVTSEASMEAFENLFKERKVEIAMKDVPQQVKEIKHMAYETVFREDLDQLDPHAKEVLDKIIGYMEKKYISGPMKLAKEIILKNAN
jgi:glutamyl-tRNA reductase